MNRRNFLFMCASVLGLSALHPKQALAKLSTVGGTLMRYSNWKTICVGRYLVDVPAEVMLNYYSNFEWGIWHGAILKKQIEPTADIKKLITSKVNELKAKPHNTMENMYIQSLPLANGGALVQGWEFKSNTETTEANLYIPVQNQKNIIYTYNITIYKHKNQLMLDDLLTFGSNFNPIPKGTIPTGEGFCIDEDTMITNLPPLFTEKCEMDIHDPSIPNFTFGISTTVYPSQRPTLKKIDGLVEESCRDINNIDGKCKKLRFDAHEGGLVTGEELCLTSNTPDNLYKTYSFEWLNPGTPESRTEPNLYASLLYTGVPLAQPSAAIPFSSDEEALAVWDRFVNSIRIRPVE